MDLIGLGVLFLVIALIAYAVGARGTAGMSAGIGRLLLIIGVVLFILFTIIGVVHGPVFYTAR